MEDLAQEFKFSNISTASWLLALRVTDNQKVGAISIDQQSYVAGMMRKYQMESVKPVATPVIKGMATDKDSKLFTNVQLYQSAVGSLNYLAQMTRPDIAYAVSRLGQKMRNPTQADWNAVKRVFGYLKHDPHRGITYRHVDGQQLELHGYSDASWASEDADRRSTSGYVFMLGGAAISWASKRQATVALSTCEAEYMAMCLVAQQAKFLRGVLGDLDGLVTRPTVIYVDNQAAKHLAENDAVTTRSKHIDIRYHFTREQVKLGNIKLEYVGTGDMVADCLTKPVVGPVLERAAEELFGFSP
jgi:hypothetical protein